MFESAICAPSSLRALPGSTLMRNDLSKHADTKLGYSRRHSFAHTRERARTQTNSTLKTPSPVGASRAQFWLIPSLHPRTSTHVHTSTRPTRPRAPRTAQSRHVCTSETLREYFLHVQLNEPRASKMKNTTRHVRLLKNILYRGGGMHFQEFLHLPPK